MPSTIEKVTFRLLPNVSRKDFAAALDRAMPWIQAQPGFEYSVVNAEDDMVTHMVYWSTEADAKAAAEAFGKAPEVAALAATIDGPTVEMKHLSVLHAFGPKVVEAA